MESRKRLTTQEVEDQLFPILTALGNVKSDILNYMINKNSADYKTYASQIPINFKELVDKANSFIFSDWIDRLLVEPIS